MSMVRVGAAKDKRLHEFSHSGEVTGDQFDCRSSRASIIIHSAWSKNSKAWSTLRAVVAVCR